MGGKFKDTDEKNNNFLERNERNGSGGGPVEPRARNDWGTERGEDVLTPNTLIPHPPSQTGWIYEME